MGKAWPVPYLLDPAHFAVDAFVAFCVAVLLAVLVSAEAQAFMATLLGDSRWKPKTGSTSSLFFIWIFSGPSIIWWVGSVGPNL